MARRNAHPSREPTFIASSMSSQSLIRASPSAPTPTLESGETVKADLVIGADGTKSPTREYVVGGPDKPTPTGDAAYRAVIPAHLLLNDPDLCSLVENPEMVSWIGPNGHIMAYAIVRHAHLPDLLFNRYILLSVLGKSTISSSSIPTTVPSSLGPPRVALTRCEPTLSVGNDPQLETHGPCPTQYVGPQGWQACLARRFVTQCWYARPASFPRKFV